MENSKKIKICPFCGEEVNINAKKCKHCREWLDEQFNTKNENITKNENKYGWVIFIVILIVIKCVITYTSNPINELIAGCTDNGEKVSIDLKISNTYYCKDKPWKTVVISKFAGEKYERYEVYKENTKIHQGKDTTMGSMFWHKGEYYCSYEPFRLGYKPDGSLTVLDDSKPCNVQEFVDTMKSKYYN